LTLKPELVLVNRGETALGEPQRGELTQLTSTLVEVPAKLEMELAELPEDDRQVFMQDLGLADFSQTATLRTLFYGMGMIVFFTIGEDECRAWPIPKGADAVEGAAQIHTDLAQNFVRARVIPFEDFKRVGSEKEARAKGLERLEGKTYIVQDGDIMHIL